MLQLVGVGKTLLLLLPHDQLYHLPQSLMGGCWVRYSTAHVATRQMKNGYVSFMLTTVGQFYHQVDSILLPW